MKTLLLSLVLLIFSLLGILDTSYLTYEHYHQVIPPCGVGFDCGKVLQSPWSMIGGVPLSVFGLVFYAVVFSLSLLYYFGKVHISFGKKVTFHVHDTLLLLTIWGFGYSIYLVSLMAFVIHAWCLFCLGSAFITTLLFITTLALWLKEYGICTQSHGSFRQSFFRLIYSSLFKPFFFCIDADIMHAGMTYLGRVLGSTSLGRNITTWIFSYHHSSLQKTIDCITFPNLIGLSAGFDYDANLTKIIPSVGFGFATVGTITWESYSGNIPPQLGRFPRSQALLVNKGFRNSGAKSIIKKLTGVQFDIPIGISIGSTNKKFSSIQARIIDVKKSFQLFESSKNLYHSYYELNISCPNTVGDQPFLKSKNLILLLKALNSVNIKKPVYIKMPIDLTLSETHALLSAASRHTFIKGVIFGNLTKDKMNPDVDPRDRTQWQTKQGNLSGKPTWNRSNMWIVYTRKHFKKRFTIIGTGGVFSGEDASQKLRSGADLVQLITGMIYEGPQLIGEINRFLSSSVQEE